MIVQNISKTADAQLNYGVLTQYIKIGAERTRTSKNIERRAWEILAC
jgi:hypothetical protein